jgi:bacterioferritin
MKTSENHVFTDTKELRHRARKNVEDGAITASYRGDREAVVGLLNQALATEIVCFLRYKRHYYMAKGVEAVSVASELLQHANEEQGHADRIAQRIVQLNGAPDFDPATLHARSHAEYTEGKSLVDMLRDNLIAERVAIQAYGELIRYLGDNDPTTRRLIEDILASEEEHAEELSDLLTKRVNDR